MSADAQSAARTYRADAPVKYQPDISGCYQPSPDMSISGDISGHIRLICPGAAPGLPGEGISLIRGLITPGVARQILGRRLTQTRSLNATLSIASRKLSTYAVPRSMRLCAAPARDHRLERCATHTRSPVLSRHLVVHPMG